MKKKNEHSIIHNNDKIALLSQNRWRTRLLQNLETTKVILWNVKTGNNGLNSRIFE